MTTTPPVPDPHPAVIHPAQILEELEGERRYLAQLNDRLLAWLAKNVLASMLTFDIALIAPLAVLPMSSNVKLALGVISGSWFQWWALPALQRTSDKADAARAAKADADHVALSHIATVVDDIARRLPADPASGLPRPRSAP